MTSESDEQAIQEVVPISSYEELIDYIENWRSWDGGPFYDVVGIFTILGACLTNMDQFLLEDESSDVGEFLEKPQIEMLRRLVSLL